VGSKPFGISALAGICPAENKADKKSFGKTEGFF
jgi:hypothetical protein